MTEQQTVSEARDSRIREAVQFVDDEFQRIQKELKARRKSVEREFASKRKDIEKRTRKELKRIETEIKKSPIVKRADEVRKDVGKQVETRFDAMLSMMQLATKSDVKRLNKKLNKLNRRLKTIEDSQLLAKSDERRTHEKLTALTQRVKLIEETRKTNGGSASASI